MDHILNAVTLQLRNLLLDSCLTSILSCAFFLPHTMPRAPWWCCLVGSFLMGEVHLYANLHPPSRRGSAGFGGLARRNSANQVTPYRTPGTWNPTLNPESETREQRERRHSANQVTPYRTPQKTKPYSKPEIRNPRAKRKAPLRQPSHPRHPKLELLNPNP